MDKILNVLIVDDDDRNIFALSAYLKIKKMKVVSASDGEECLQKMEETKPDIVLLDMMMPVMDGFETLKHIRENERFRHTKVIALTALAMKGDAEKCLEAGANDYCSKPIDIDLLINKINSLLN